MTDSVPALCFLYTSATFGHDGINGFQFVGLPQDGASQDLIDFVAERIGYTAPLGVPSQPTSEEIERHFPLSTRIVPGAPGGHTALVQSRYIGQVYRENGERGKWGNFLGHARVVPTSGATAVALIDFARNSEWRKELSTSELCDARPLDLPTERIDMPVKPYAAHIMDRERAAGLAAIFARLDGDAPLLLPDTEPDDALAVFQDLAAHLPLVLGQRISWSSFEFDTGPGYDVLATIGDTRLAAERHCFMRLDSLPNNPIYLWAGEIVCREGHTFWDRLQLFDDLSGRTRLADAFDMMRRIDEAGPHHMEPVLEALAVLRNGPSDRSRIAAAEDIFARGFCVLGGPETDNFVLLTRAGHEARALARWSGSDRSWQDLIGWAVRFPAIATALSERGASEPLAGAMLMAVEAGVEAEAVIDVTLAVTRTHLAQPPYPGALAEAVLAVLPDGGQSPAAAQIVLRLAKNHLRTAPDSAFFEALLMRSGQAAGLDWLGLMASELPRIAPELASRIFPDLELVVLESIADDPVHVAKVIQRIEAAAVTPAVPLDRERTAKLLKRLDAAFVSDRRNRRGNAKGLMRAAQAHTLGNATIPNALALEAIGNRDLLSQILSDRRRFDNIYSHTTSDVYAAFFDQAMPHFKAASMREDQPLLAHFWRIDIRDHFVQRVARHYQSRSIRTPLVQRLEDVIMAAASKPHDPGFAADWQKICTMVAVSFARKLDVAAVNELARKYPSSRIVSEVSNRRTTGLATAKQTIGRALRSLFSRR